MTGKLIPVVWIMHTAAGWYPIQPSSKCRAEDHGRLNDHVNKITDDNGRVLWERGAQ